MERIEQLRLIALSLAKYIENFKRRRITAELKNALERKPRIKLLKGFRGTGKTTAILQLFQDDIEHSFYFSADHPIIKEFGIYNVSKDVIKNGYRKIFIDEIHTYPKWKEEVKALHDEFPDIKIVATGSAPLAFNPERREELISLYPMDLGEFVLLSKSLSIKSENEWKDKESTMQFMASHQMIESDFNKYTRYSAYPLSLELDEERALDAIYHSIRKSIREDAVFFLNMSKEKIFGMENLLNYLATSPLGSLSVTSLSNSLGPSKTVIYEMINALEGMDIIRIIRPYKKGLPLARAEPKMLFTHPNLRFAMCKQLGATVDTGAVREELAVFSLIKRGWFVHTIKGMKKSPDYLIEKGNEKLVIEIGGPSKTKAQLRGFEKGLVITEYQLIPLSIVAKSAEIG